jgi:hypothetical protein
MKDASLSIYISDDLGGRPAAVPSCDWRKGRSCTVPATVLVHLAEIDDGSSEQFCQVHAEVMAGAAVTRMWGRFRSATPEPEGEQQ